MLIFLGGLLGLLVGSFLNVVIYRLPLILIQRQTEEAYKIVNAPIEPSFSQPTFNLAWPASHCPKCKTSLRWWHNLPLISYCLLRGRCAFCEQKIPLKYPLVELLSTLSSIAVSYQFGTDFITLSYALMFTWFLIVLTFIDLSHQLLPDELTLSLLWIGLLANLTNRFVALPQAILGAVIGYVTLWLIAHLFKWIRKIEGLGYGDLKLFAALGAWLGWASLPKLLLVSSTLALCLALILMLHKKIRYTDTIPFGPYLAISGWLFLVIL